MRRLVLGVLAVTAVACGRQDAGASGAPSGPLARVLVDSAGGVHLNGRRSTIAALGESLRVVQAQGGGVVYAREAPDREPPAAQANAIRGVLAAITTLRLPVRLAPAESLSTVGR
jgi:hypothetical protein